MLLLYSSQCFCMPNWYKLLTPYFIYPGKVEITNLLWRGMNECLSVVQAVFLTTSVFMMISIAVERYTAVFYPFSRLVGTQQK